MEADGARVYSDDANAHADPTWRTVSFSIGGGVHTIRIGYTHNGTGYSYEHNGVWVDRFRAPDGIAPPPEEPVQPAPAKYTVRFVANGGTGSMPAQKMACGTAAALAANRFRRTGWIFLGWARTKTGAVAYRDRKSVKDLAKKGGTATLYAQWAKKAYKVKFYANGGKGRMAAQKMTYGKAARLKANKFKRTGFTFKGWAKSKALAKKGKVAYKNKKKVKNLVKNGKTVKLYAVWKKRKK